MSKHDVLAEIKEAREDGFTTWEINKHQMDSIIALKSELAALEAVAEAARAVVFEYWESPESTPSKANIAMKDLVDKVDALKGAE